MPLSPFRRLAKSFRAVFAALAMAVLLSPALASAQGSYRLGPGDLISVRVLGWDALNLEFVVYDALGGEFTVDGDGNVNLPLLGLVLAMGIDVAELSDDIGRRYQARLGLAEAPSAAVEVAEYRPIYILGDVSQPGRYPFEPGLTPIRAVALAGGLFRLIDQNENGEATATRMIGNLDEVRGDLARQRMRAVRLRAELAEANFDLPEDMPRHPDGDAAQVVLFDHEASLFDGRAQQLSNAIASIDESRNLLRTEVAALEEKQTGIARQLVLIR
ncbi:MAG: polysaccharide biosynthesis/export family protein [Pseudomonadota bacterium]